MPFAEMTILDNNDLELVFNDTMVQTTIDPSDILLRIYGPASSYEYTLTAEYIDDVTVMVYTEFETNIAGGEQEYLVLEFENRDAFVSANSLRGVNIESSQGGYLNKQTNQSNTGILGQSAMYIFLLSVVIAIVSSFGGNSMEMMWGLMNTLQILYFLSYIFVEYPSDLDSIFAYLGWACANNEYLSQMMYFFLSDRYFSQAIVNEKIGEISFYINSSDKFPILIATLSAFLFTFIFDK